MLVVALLSCLCASSASARVTGNFDRSRAVWVDGSGELRGRGHSRVRLRFDRPTGGSGASSAAHVDTDTTGVGLRPQVQSPLAEISCPSFSLCFGSDDNGGLVASQDPTGGAPSCV